MTKKLHLWSILVLALSAFCLALPGAAVGAPVAQPAQSGPNEYSEGGVPTGTGDTEDPDPVAPADPTPAPGNDDPAPTSAGQSAPAGSSVPAESTTEATPAAAELPRTGLETWLIALIGIVALAAGVLIRRRPAATPHA